MNYHSLTSDESKYILFAFKKTLRDRDGLTPSMVQFYESSIDLIADKLERLQKSGDNADVPQRRNRPAKVQATWPSN